MITDFDPLWAFLVLRQLNEQYYMNNSGQSLANHIMKGIDFAGWHENLNGMIAFPHAIRLVQVMIQCDWAVSSHKHKPQNTDEFRNQR